MDVDPALPDTTIPTLPDALARICADTLATVARRRAALSADALRSKLGRHPPATRGFGAALKHAVAAGGYGLIAGDQEGVTLRRADPAGLRPGFHCPGLCRRRRHMPVRAD